MEQRRVAKVRIEMIKEKSVYCKTQELSSSERAAEFARSLYYETSGDELRCPTKEIMTVCSVDTKGKPLVIEYVSVGTTTGALVGMKEVFMSAILCNAAAIICFHNHPSGNPTPSMADNLLTEKLKKAGEILDLPLRDHIIIGDEGYYSFEEKCVCKWKEDCFEKAG